MSYRVARIMGTNEWQDFLPFPIFDAPFTPTASTPQWENISGLGGWRFVMPRTHATEAYDGRLALTKLFSRVRRWTMQVQFSASMGGQTVSVNSTTDLTALAFDERYMPHAKYPRHSIFAAASGSTSSYPYVVSASYGVGWQDIVAIPYDETPGTNEVCCMIPQNASAPEVFNFGGATDLMPIIYYDDGSETYAFRFTMGISVTVQTGEVTQQVIDWTPYGDTFSSTVIGDLTLEGVTQGSWDYTYLGGGSGLTVRLDGDSSSFNVTNFYLRPTVGPSDTYFDYDGVYDGSDGSQLITPVPLTM